MKAKELAMADLAERDVKMPKKPKGDDQDNPELMDAYQRKKQEFDVALRITKAEKLKQVKRDLTPEQEEHLRKITKPEGYVPPPMEAVNAT